MEVIQNGVRVLFLPDNAYCDASTGKRSPFDLGDCPLGCGACDGDCPCYREDDERYDTGGWDARS